ncbi:hypothetical protein [Cellulomonas massiliensis]|uniref:hypothetical protein n=1 Tax=Cellulomonas massiliensis TaxID=1465811 RepID=UPI00037706BD|nr:hypothetical protein [Cellulomonas massiliensis]
MTTAGRPALRALARRAVVPAAALAGLLGPTAGALSGRVLVHQCVEAGAASWLGLRLAVLQTAADCPEGTLGLGPTTSGSVMLLSVALPVLALHVVLTALGLGGGAVVVRALRTAWSALVASLGTVPGAVASVPRAHRAAVVGPRVVVAAGLPRHALSRRGPPLPA